MKSLTQLTWYDANGIETVSYDSPNDQNTNAMLLESNGNNTQWANKVDITVGKAIALNNAQNFNIGGQNSYATGPSQSFNGTQPVQMPITEISMIGNSSNNKSASNIILATNAVEQASSSNGANTIIKRDANGNFSANVITANLSGTATNATHATYAANADAADNANHANVADNANHANVTDSANSVAAANVTGILSVNHGGTGANLYDGINGYVLMYNSSDHIGYWGDPNGTKVADAQHADVADLANSVAATNVTGTLSVGHGGTGVTSITSGALLVGNGAGAVTTVAKGSANAANTIVQRDAGGNFSACTITANLSGAATKANSANYASNVGTSGTQYDSYVSAIDVIKVVSNGINTDSVVFGKDSSANDNAFVAIGPGAVASGFGAVALGQGVSCANNTVIIGSGSTGGTSSVIIGGSITSNNTRNIGIGSGVNSRGVASIAIGAGAYADGDSAIAIGSNGTVHGSNSTYANGVNSIAIGAHASTGGVNAICIGVNSSGAGYAGVIAIGANSRGLHGSAIAIGSNSHANGVAIGSSTFVNCYGIAIGSGANANNDSVAIGRISKAGSSSTNNAIAIGYNSNAYGTNSVQIGEGNNQLADSLKYRDVTIVKNSASVLTGLQANNHTSNANNQYRVWIDVLANLPTSRDANTIYFVIE